jgi:sulfite reductase (ferredoxin)
MMEGFLFEADQELHLAGVMAEKGQTGHAVNKAYRAIVAAAKGLLVLEGVDSSIDAEILFKAETLLVGKEILPRAFARLTDQVKDLGPKSPTVEFAREKITYAKSFVEASHSAFDKHGRSLKLAKTHTAEPPEAVEKPVRGLPTTTPATIRLDLSGVACPINYVKTKLKLEELEVGQHLEVILDDGEPIRNVPKSLQGDGQKILSQEKIDEQHYRLLVEKVN